MKTKGLSFPTFKTGAAKSADAGPCPSAEFTPVPANRQARVTQSVRQAIEASLQIAPGRSAAVKELLAHVGEPDFYDVLAKQDPGHASQWTEMGKVQRQFAAAEPKYDPKTRAYSESMRLTLHASVLQHFAEPVTNKGMKLYDRFLALHPTAFHQNGGWFNNLKIPICGAMAVAEVTPVAMYQRTEGLLVGAFISDKPTLAAAQWVREGRRAALEGWAR